VARSFPKPLTISSHTMRAVNKNVLSPLRRLVLNVQSRIHSKDGRQFALLLAKLNIPIIAINAITQILVPPPKYMINQLVPTARYGDSGLVRRIFIIGRGPEAEDMLSHDEAMTIMLANTEDAYGFPPFSIMERAITLRTHNLRSGKKQDISVLRSLEREILGDFLHNISVSRLISPNFGWADVIPQRVLRSSQAELIYDHRLAPGMPADAAHGTNGQVRMPADNESRAARNGNGEHVRSVAWQHEEARR
jgi:dolichol-phosphate mannosyltransferase